MGAGDSGCESGGIGSGKGAGAVPRLVEEEPDGAVAGDGVDSLMKALPLAGGVGGDADGEDGGGVGGAIDAGPGVIDGDGVGAKTGDDGAGDGDGVGVKTGDAGAGGGAGGAAGAVGVRRGGCVPEGAGDGPVGGVGKASGGGPFVPVFVERGVIAGVDDRGGVSPSIGPDGREGDTELLVGDADGGDPGVDNTGPDPGADNADPDCLGVCFGCVED